MTTRFTLETSALGTVNYHRRRDSAIAGIIVQMRPHPSGRTHPATYRPDGSRTPS